MDPGLGAQQRPTISMPNATPAGAKKSSIFDEEYSDSQRREHQREARTSGSSQQSSRKSKDKKGELSSSSKSGPGWFGGIFNKLSLKPKNQMILPDDKDPSIVWDEDKQRWRDKDAGEAESPQASSAPPSVPMSNYNQQHMPLGGPSLQQVPGGMPPAGGNLFKMQKSRHIKKAYVDVFNPGGANTSVPSQAPALQPQHLAPQQNMFVPGHDGHASGQMYDHQMNY